ncbi:MAG TPA: DUF3226 domain-containing protein [Blastocatellia bacterium]|nr:DUF3226 domain-containing protein [Blastocatellia bacterium]
MPQRLVKITKRKLLIGEGLEEVRFFKAFLKHLGIDTIQTEQYGGKDKLAAFLKTIPSIPGFERLESLGVTRDADTSPAAARQSVEASLQRADLPMPSAADLPHGGLSKVSVFIMPDDQGPGMLEDLCLKSVESDRVRPSRELCGRVPRVRV